MAKTAKSAPPTLEPDPPPIIDEDTGEHKFEAKEVILEEPKTSEPAPIPVPADEGVTELRRQLDVRNAELRERDAQIETERNQRLQAERQVGAVSSSMVDQAIEAAKNHTLQLRQQYISAQTAGNYEAAADIQIAIGDNRANLLALQQQKQWADMQAQQPQQRQALPRAEPAEDRATAIAADLERGRYPKSAEWIRANRNQVADDRGINRVNSAHQYVVNIKGLIPETPEYFARLEEELGIRQAAESEPESAPRPIQTRAAPARAAPVSSSTPSLNGQQNRRMTVSLNKEQVEHAEILGMSLEEYATVMSDPAIQKRLLGTQR